MNKRAVILLGPQGSGKGTQAKNLITSFSSFGKVSYLEMGEILRNKRNKDPVMDTLFKSFVDRGDRVPDHIIEEIFKEKFLRLLNSTDNFILDGCIRTVQQANFIKKIFNENGISFIVIVLDLPKQRCKERIRVRISESDRPRPDDLDDEAVENRLNAYFSSLFPILDVLGDYKIVDARREAATVFDDICIKVFS